VINSRLPRAARREDDPMANIMGMMKQAAELKSKMEAMQAELDQIEVEGSSGGNLVTVKINAKGELKSVSIDPSLMKPDEKEIVEDLIVAAHGDARRKAERVLQEKMEALTGGLPIPPGMKLF
jgi:nucleoid-associated protein EbfC